MLANASRDQTVRAFDVRSMEWVVLRGHKEHICCTSYPTFQSPRPDASLTLCHQTAPARHPVHPILVYGGSEREILLWDLSSPTVGTPTPIFPTCPITIRSHRHHFPCIARRARVVSTSTANAPSCDALPGGRLKHLS